MDLNGNVLKFLLIMLNCNDIKFKFEMGIVPHLLLSRMLG